MILVLGAGVAGLSCAITAASTGAQVTLVTPGKLEFVEGASELGQRNPAFADSGTALADCNTALAQGGIAAAIGAGDAPGLHVADTVAAGVGLVDEAAARLVCEDGAVAVRALIEAGFAADRLANGELSLGLEAAHGRPRIVHSGEDRTGASLHAFLRARLHPFVLAGRVQLTEHTTAVSLLGDADGSATGAVLRNEQGELSAVSADAVVLATGGYAGLYNETSNHAGAQGEGIVLAARLGAVVADLEFVQFHPTVLAGTGFLISEAVRGAGAVLRDSSGKRFMLDVHEAAELAPRDVVSRAIHRVLRASGEPHVWLDAVNIERELSGTLARRFPSITAATLKHGFDWSREPIPVAPAAHYSMGGVVTDLDARTSLPGLFAAGEVANTGVHGANRLASNSLLEGLVFGARAARSAVEYARIGAQPSGCQTAEASQPRDRQADSSQADIRQADIRQADMRQAGSWQADIRQTEMPQTEIRQINSWQLRGAGANRLVESAREFSGAHDPGLTQAQAQAQTPTPTPPPTPTPTAIPMPGAANPSVREAISRGLGIERDEAGLREVLAVAQANDGFAAELATMMAHSALARTESRGAHQRSDFSETDSSQGRRRGWVVRSSRKSNEPSDLSNSNRDESKKVSAC